MYNILNYISLFSSLYMLINNIEFTNNNISKKLIVQTVLGTIHTYTIIIMGIIFNNAPYTYSNTIKDIVINFSSSYFIFDIIFIIFKDISQWVYIPHHILSISLLYSLKLNYINLFWMAQYYYYLELSNALLAVWDLSRKYKLINPVYYNNLTPFMVTMYVPIRSTIIPILSIVNIYYINDYKIILSIPYILLAALSIVYSFKLVKILKYKLKTVQDKTAYTFYTLDERWFGNIVYLFKFFINLILLVHVIPFLNNKSRIVPFILYDIISIFVSTVYYTSYFSEKYEFYDIMTIFGKIILENLLATNKFNIFTITCHSISITSLFTYLLKNNSNKLLNNRSMLFIVTSIFSSIPTIVHSIQTNNMYAIFTLINYALGFYMYLNNVEAWYNRKVLNRLGWLHIFVVIGNISGIKYLHDLK
jgi:hypothetical protein